MIIHEIAQGDNEWLKLRLGKLTASDFHTLMGKSQTKETILYKKAAERLTGVASDGDRFTSIHTERGHELEPEARMAYELEKGGDVLEVGFVELNEFVGCSPDGLVNADGGVEIKCMDNHGFLKAVTKSYINPIHKTQMQYCMYVCGRSWWDYALYNPNFPNPLHVMKVMRDDEYITDIQTHIKECNEKIESHIKIFEGFTTGTNR